MPDAVPVVLWSWVPITLLLFWKLPPARATAASLLGGWLILPTARYPDIVASFGFPYWIMPAALPADVWTTKARVIGLAALLGVSAFDPGAWRRFRPDWLDLPMAAWCLVPVGSGLANGSAPIGALADAAYLALGWGVPYLVGRIYFADPAGQMTLARAIVVGGLACVPIGLAEWAVGPFAYRSLFGFHPFQFAHANRYIGSRPIGMLENGNQFGTWMATSALVAGWLWRGGRLDRFGGIPGWLVAGVLILSAILTQSAGAVILLVAGLGAMEAVARINRTWVVVMVLLVPLAFVGLRALNIVDVKALAMRTSAGRALADASTRLDRQSFGWRLQVEQRAAKVALARPVLGWGRWDWWTGATEGERPWGLFSLTLGMYGLIGWAALLLSFGNPLVAWLALGRPATWTTVGASPAAALAGALALNFGDAILNASLILPILAASGALVGAYRRDRERMAWVRRIQGGAGR